jgi:hypothetical protein
MGSRDEDEWGAAAVNCEVRMVGDLRGGRLRFFHCQKVEAVPPQRHQ